MPYSNTKMQGSHLKMQLVKRVKEKKKLKEPHRDKINKMACAPSEDTNQPGHPHSLIKVFDVRLKGS